jgi:hypothetical protein
LRHWTVRRIVVYGVAIAALLLSAAAALEWRNISRIMFAQSMFGGGDQLKHFRRMSSIFAGHVVHRSVKPYEFMRGTPISLPKSFLSAGNREDTGRFLAATDTTGLLHWEGRSMPLQRP